MPSLLPSLLIDRRDLDFQLYDVLRVQDLTARDRFAEHSRETFDASIDTALRLAERYFAPHNRKSDLEEPRFDGSRVHVIPEVREALDAFSKAGMMAAGQDFELGGMQLPHTVALAGFGLFKAANMATASYPMLTMAAANLILAHGSEEQKARYVPNMLAGRWFGTMALTEPHAGSSLADIRTTAEPAGDGTWRLTGNKIFISGGDHDLSENIVHMVLGRVRGAPAGIRGISLFLVPKFLVEPDGSLGRRNDVALAGLIHKMGWRGTTSTMLNFGEGEGAVAWLVGEPNQGLSYMFHMMNEARIAVGLGAVMLGYTGYLHALDYARSRPQGRPAGAKDPSTPQRPIIEHADVRRMLLAQKAYVEGGLALCLYAARLVDERRTAADEGARREAGLLLDILTPLVKAWPAQYCLEANDLAIQVHGGYGYTREYPVEQFYRDNRLNPIHEGTNGIQALDLLGRKVTMEGGAAFRLLAREIRAAIDRAASGEAAGHAADLARTWDLIERVTSTRAAGPSDRALANASLYLDLVGHAVVAWMWLRQAVAVREHPDAAFRAGKLQACRYFFHYELPRARAHAEVLLSLDPTLLDMRPDWF